MRTRKINLIIIYALLTIGAVIILIPLIWMVSTALKTEAEIGAWPPTLIPRNPIWTNFAAGWKTQPFTRMLINTFIYCIGAVIIGGFFMALTGYVFAKFKFRGSNFMFIVAVATMMIPTQVIIIPMFLMMKNLNLLNTFFGIILPEVVNGFGIFLMRQFFLTVPDDIIEAARLDGCSEIRIFFKIILPVSRPAITTLIIFIVLYRWNDLIWPLINTTSNNMYTLPVGIASFQGVQYGIVWNNLMAVSTLVVIPLIILYLIFQKYLIRGIVLTQLK
jgi:ABC-type glycerol-3-phosphate transport system permease component